MSQPRDRETVSYTIEGIDPNTYRRLRLLCFHRNIYVKNGILTAIDEFVENHKDEIEKLLDGVRENDDETQMG